MLYIDMPDDPISILIDQFLYRFSTYSQKIKKLKIWMLEVKKQKNKDKDKTRQKWLSTTVP